MKWPSEILQTLPYFYHKKTHIVFSFFISCNFIFLPNECPGLCRHRPGQSWGKNVALLEIANFKAFFWVFLSRTNGLFLNYDPKKLFQNRNEVVFVFQCASNTMGVEESFFEDLKTAHQDFSSYKKRKSYSCNFSWCIFVTR